MVTQSAGAPSARAWLEAATVIRVPPPGYEPGYAVAVVRTDDGLHTARLTYSGDQLPPVGTELEPAEPEAPGVPTYRPVGA